MIQVCKKHPNGLKGVFESAGRRIPASVQREEESTATTDTATAATSASNVQNVEMPDANMPEEEDGFDIKELLDQEHSTDLAEDEYMIPPGSEGKKRMAVVEAAGKVARGMKRREMNQEEESSNIG